MFANSQLAVVAQPRTRISTLSFSISVESASSTALSPPSNKSENSRGWISIFHGGQKLDSILNSRELPSDIGRAEVHLAESLQPFAQGRILKAA
jgi:hypothetical protein